MKEFTVKHYITIGFAFLIVTGSLAVSLGLLANQSWLAVIGTLDLFASGVLGGIIFLGAAFLKAIKNEYE